MIRKISLEIKIKIAIHHYSIIIDYLRYMYSKLRDLCDIVSKMENKNSH